MFEKCFISSELKSLEVLFLATKQMTNVQVLQGLAKAAKVTVLQLLYSIRSTSFNTTSILCGANKHLDPECYTNSRIWRSSLSELEKHDSESVKSSTGWSWNTFWRSVLEKLLTLKLTIGNYLSSNDVNFAINITKGYPSRIILLLAFLSRVSI